MHTHIHAHIHTSSATTQPKIVQTSVLAAGLLENPAQHSLLTSVLMTAGQLVPQSNKALPGPTVVTRAHPDQPTPPSPV